MKLKYIFQVDFHKNTLTNYETIAENQRLRLGPNEVLLFVSPSLNQMEFVHGITTLDKELPSGQTKKVKVIASSRFRMQGGTFNPQILREYAESVGLNIENFERFEKAYQNLKAQQAASGS